MSDDRINALRKALELTPDNDPLRLMMAEQLQQADRLGEAVDEYEVLLESSALPAELLVTVGNLALDVDRLDLAERCLSTALAAGIVDGTAALRAKIDAKNADQGRIRVVLPVRPGDAFPAALHDSETSADAVTFADVGGLDEVKKTVHRLIILPQMRPEIYHRYGRKGGGGVLLFGPPGCGKTLLARATAGECGLPFFNVRIEDILDPYFGMSERNLHAVFQQARTQAPCVLFLDELDALAYARRRQHEIIGRTLVDQLLQEMDAIGADNRHVLIMAATNEPWDVDSALLRPGRFDRRIFVPPPDLEARRHILELLLAIPPTERLDLQKLAELTPLFSGADLKALVEGAIDQAIEEALRSDSAPPITMEHLEHALAELRPTTLDWLSRAKNYVAFANQDNRYKEIADFLQTAEVRRLLS